jgi:hypothetical protein
MLFFFEIYHGLGVFRADLCLSDLLILREDLQYLIVIHISYPNISILLLVFTTFI